MRRIVIIVALLFVLATSATAQEAVNYRVEPCAVATPPFFEAECGFLSVPEDRNDPASPMIEIAVMRIFAGDEGASANPPLFYIPGGPGGSVLANIGAGFPAQFAPLARQRDMIFIDPRGTGLSTPRLFCPEVANGFINTLTATIVTERADLLIDQLNACRDRLAIEGVNLGAYNTNALAADLVDLKNVLGYDEWNLFGVSYGTRVVLTILRDYPEGVRSIILDSAYPLEVDLYSNAIDNTERALDALFNACAVDERCNGIFPDLENIFYETYVDLNNEQATVSINAGPSGVFDMIIDGTRMYDWAFNWLYALDDIALLPRRIYAMATNNFDAVAISGAQAEAVITRIDLGVYMATQCNEEAPFISADSLQAQIDANPELADYIQSEASLSRLEDLCIGWRTGEPDPRDNEAVVSDVPALVLSGLFDPVTPPGWGELVANNLSNSQFYLFENVGHGVIRTNTCATLVARNFLDAPTDDAKNACVDAQGGIRFIVGAQQ